MNKYLSFFRMRFIGGLQYRLAAYAGAVTQFAWGSMRILMFQAFYKANAADFSMEFPQLSSYIWLQQAFLALFATWFIDNEIFLSITSGNIAYELARPVDLYNMWFVKNLANRLSRAALRCMPILIVASFLPRPYGISLPVSPFAFFMFLISLLLGLFVVIAFCMLIYIATFYSLSPLGIRIVALSLTEFLMGAIIPLPFFPKRLQKIIQFTPFASMQNLPFRIYSGNIAGKEMLVNVLLQIFWLIILLIIGKFWMKRALKKVVIQGG